MPQINLSVHPKINLLRPGRRIQNILDNYKFVEMDKAIIIRYNEKQKELSIKQKEYDNLQKYIDNNVLIIVELLEKEGFLIKETDINKNKINIILITQSCKHSLNQ